MNSDLKVIGNLFFHNLVVSIFSIFRSHILAVYDDIYHMYIKLYILFIIKFLKENKYGLSF